MSKLIRIEGADNGKCAGCGCDLSQDLPQFVFHGDGADTFCYGFSCVKCGQSIVEHFQRDQDEGFGWDDEDEYSEMEPVDDGGVM